jgi:hypothetical protein
LVAESVGMAQGTVPVEQVRQRQLQRYLSDGLGQVEGWLDPRSAKVIAALGEYQTAQGIRGAVGEIGVHHGKLLVLLDLIKAKGEISFAVDLFDDQKLNVDQSGLGDYSQLARNLEKFSTGLDRVEIFKRNSMDLRADDLLAACGPVRLFSVDGGHTAACTLNDIQISEASTLDHGLVVVDDYFNPSWPDVSAGVAQYIFHRGSTLRPFAISPNKLYLARSHCHERYRTALKERVARYHLKTSTMYDHDVDIYGYDQSTSWRRRLINYVKKTPIGAPIHRIYRHHSARKQSGARVG